MTLGDREGRPGDWPWEEIGFRFRLETQGLPERRSDSCFGWKYSDLPVRKSTSCFVWKHICWLYSEHKWYSGTSCGECSFCIHKCFFCPFLVVMEDIHQNPSKLITAWIIVCQCYLCNVIVKCVYQNVLVQSSLFWFCFCLTNQRLLKQEKWNFRLLRSSLTVVSKWSFRLFF
jgi:hypothetical protein